MSHRTFNSNWVQRTYQLNDLDKHPVVRRGCQKFEELRRKGKIVFGVPPGQLANDVHGSRNNGYSKISRYEC